ncbi:MAG: P-type conjugative transfer protein TrbL, partial [Achromobacter sp.]
ARMAPAAAKLAGGGARAAAGAASSAKSAFQAGSASAGGGLKGSAAGVGNVAKTGAQAAGQKVADAARSMKERVAAAFRPDDAPASAGAGGPQGGADTATSPTAQPAWAKRLHRRQQFTHAATTAAHTLRGGDAGSSSQGPSLRDD